MRRGRLYLPEETGGAAPGSLEMALTQAFQKSDNQGILDVTGKILPGDQADIRAHMLRAVALRRLGREKEANFHRERQSASSSRSCTPATGAASTARGRCSA